MVPSTSYGTAEALKELPRDRKKQKNTRYSGNISFNEMVNIARQMHHRPLARELSGTIKEILWIAQSVVCHVDGCHPNDIIDDVNSGVVECSALEPGKLPACVPQLKPHRAAVKTQHSQSENKTKTTTTTKSWLWQLSWAASQSMPNQRA